MSQIQKLFADSRKQPATVETAQGKGYRVVISSDRVDRAQDVVKQNWTNIADINDRGLIACFQHDRNRMVGRFFDLKTEKRGANSYTSATLVLLPPESSDDARLANALVERGWADFSIGFHCHDVKTDKNIDGYVLDKNELYECSVVAVPANPDAQPELRSLRKEFEAVCDPKTGRCHLPAREQLNKSGATASFNKNASNQSHSAARVSATSRQSNTLNSTVKTMTISEKIKAAEDALVARKDALAQVLEVDVDDEGNLNEDGALKADELTAQIEKAEADIARLKKIEGSLMKTATPASAPGAPARVEMSKNRRKGHVFTGAIACKLKAHNERRNPVEIAREHFKDDAEIETFIKADTAPADTTTSGWASQLVQETVGQFFDLVRDISVYPQLPGPRLTFDRYGQISVPYNASSHGQLAGGFVGQGSAIPVKAGSYAEKTLAPKKLGVISTFTKEIAMHSMPAIQQLIENQIVRDTASTLDSLFFDAEARTATRPAGLQDATDGAGAANVNASAGATTANILTDLKGVLTRVSNARVGQSGVWVMHPLRRLGLMTAQDAASGEYPFRDEINAGRLMGFPVVISQSMTAGLVAFIPNDTIVYANDYAPRIDVSDTATLHMVDASALPIVDDAGVVADPVRSLYQTDTIGVKMTMGLDWLVIRANGAQVLTGVAW